jgi:hypothetical protein
MMICTPVKIRSWNGIYFQRSTIRYIAGAMLYDRASLLLWSHCRFWAIGKISGYDWKLFKKHLSVLEGM